MGINLSNSPDSEFLAIEGKNSIDMGRNKSLDLCFSVYEAGLDFSEDRNRDVKSGGGGSGSRDIST